MKTLVIALLLTGISQTGFSLPPFIYKFKTDIILPPDERFSVNKDALHNPTKGDTLIQKFRERPNNNLLPYNGIPNSILHKLQPDKYLGNNEKGQDIYQSQLDYMPILKPDSSFSSVMPVKPFRVPVFPRISLAIHGGDYPSLIDSLSTNKGIPKK